MDAEFANLRAGFRWAADQGDLATAAAIAAHTALLAWALQRFEPVGWAEEILDGRRPRICVNSPASTPPPASAVHRTARRRRRLRPDGGRVGGRSPLRPVRTGMERPAWEAAAHLYAGRIERCLEICADLAAQPGLAHVVGLCGMLYVLPAVGRAEEARPIAEETVAAARAHGNPFWIAWRVGRVRAGLRRDRSGPSPGAFRQGLAFAQSTDSLWETRIARDAAGLEAVHGELEQALALFDTTIDSFHRAGNVANLAATLADLAVFFDRIERPEIAATLYGASTHHGSISMVDQPSRRRGPPARRARRDRVRRLRRRRGGHGTRRRRPLRPPPDPARAPRNRRRLVTSATIAHCPVSHRGRMPLGNDGLTSTDLPFGRACAEATAAIGRVVLCARGTVLVLASASRSGATMACARAIDLRVASGPARSARLTPQGVAWKPGPSTAEMGSPGDLRLDRQVEP